jgi:hypothetical protein
MRNAATQPAVETPARKLDHVIEAIKNASAVSTALEAYVVHQEIFEPDEGVVVHLTQIIDRELTKAYELTRDASEQLTKSHAT